MESLDRDTWLPRARAHGVRVDPYLRPHLDRRRRGEAHPVHDFLFSYYSQSPGALRRWHPGFGTALLDAPEYAGLRGYRPVATSGHAPDQSGHSVAVTTAHLTAQRRHVEQARTLLTATASRPASLGCFGLHEWAMVYRSTDPRHPAPLRLGSAGTDDVVDAHRISCTHFDAYRFFTDAARPLNALRPGSADRPAFEQPGCLHAGMDLYGKVAVRLSPLIGSELVADAFELAWDIRILDMRAAPYDFTGLTLDPTDEPWTPVKIETPEGKAEYVAMQREFSERGAPIRRSLIDACDRLLDGEIREDDHAVGQ